MNTRVLALTLLIAWLVSCTDSNNAAEPGPLPGTTWRLVSMSGNLANVSPATGNRMTWQETYAFHTDGTFTKKRERDGVTTEASGTFAIVAYNFDEFVELTYPTDDPIIGNCSALPVEMLQQVSDSLVGTWQICDGPGLVYKMVSADK